MGCRCNERRQATIQVIKSAVKADVQEIGRELTFIAKSAAEDASTAFRSSVAAAKSRLMRKR